MKRRTFLASASAALCLPGLPVSADTAPSLREIANPKGIEIGSIFSHAASDDEKWLIRRHCNVVVTENALKPNWLYRRLFEEDSQKIDLVCEASSLAQDKDAPCLKLVERTVAFANASTPKLGIHAHPVYWAKRGLPVAENLTVDAYRTAWAAHIERLVGYVPDAVSWDVINEPFSKDLCDLRAGRSKALAADQILCTDWDRLLDHYAFVIQTLRSALKRRGKTARLLLNEAELEGTGEAHQIKRSLLPELLAQLERRGAKLDGVGLQCHLSKHANPDGAICAQFIKDLASAGYVAHISELDFRASSETAEEAEADQAQIVGDFLDHILAEPTVKRLSFWGLSDENHVFRRDKSDATANKSDTFAKLSPTVFGENRRPKAVFDRILAAIADAPKR